jgi:hypothetical protein
METQVQYPEWQIEIRKAQVEEQAAYREKLEKQATETRAWHLKLIEEMRGELAERGLTLPTSETGVWELDGYIFKVQRTHSYEHLLYVEKCVPDAVVYDEDKDFWWDLGYRNVVNKVLVISNLSGGEIADALDEVDNLVIQQIETNRNILARIEAQQAQPKPEPFLKDEPTLESRLADLIREIVREEMGAVRDSQWESLL